MKLKNEDGSFFVDALGRTEFDNYRKYSDGSTETRVGVKQIITNKDGSLREE